MCQVLQEEAKGISVASERVGLNDERLERS